MSQVIDTKTIRASTGHPASAKAIIFAASALAIGSASAQVAQGPIVQAVTAVHPPASPGRREVRILYAAQTAVAPYSQPLMAEWERAAVLFGLAK